MNFILITLLTLICPNANATNTKTATILVLGDSIAEGYGLKQTESFPHLIQEELIKKGFKSSTVINAGISGSTSASGVFRLKHHLKSNPTHLILELGANDGLRGLSIESLKKNLKDVILLAHEKKLKVILCGMKMPTSYGGDYTKKYESVFEQVARETKATFLPFLLEGIAGDPKLNQADGIHPTAEGQKIVAKTVLKTLLPLLK